MTKIYFITGNNSKFEEAKALLKNKEVILEKKDIPLIEIQTLDQKEITQKKAEQAYAKLKKPVIVDDTAIYFEEYTNFPGTYTKHLFEALGFKGLKRVLHNAKKEAYFKTVLCFYDGKNMQFSTGTLKGKITDNISKKFNPDWQYNSIFIPAGYNKTLSEFSIEERSQMSHRKKALQKLMRHLRK